MGLRERIGWGGMELQVQIAMGNGLGKVIKEECRVNVVWVLDCCWGQRHKVDAQVTAKGWLYDWGGAGGAVGTKGAEELRRKGRALYQSSHGL